MGQTVTDPIVGRLIDGRYEVVSRIARGGMATVYLAVDRRLDREVAVKVMHPHLAEAAEGGDFVARFRREARAVARLVHPGLVQVFDQGVDGETTYLAMEYVDGTNLRRRLGQQIPTLGESLTVVEKVLDALSTAHRVGLVHRDIKPENVLIASDGRIKLADFGLARVATELTAATTGTVLGTVAYLAPELIAQGASDARTDVYAVGVLLYEMLTGRQPFSGASPVHIAFQHVNSDVPAPSDTVPWLPSEVDELVAALAARDPDERPADAPAALALVKRTRTDLDTDVLARRAEPDPAVDATQETAVHDAQYHAKHLAADEQQTELLAHREGATVALPIGLGLAPRPTASVEPVTPGAATDVPAPGRRRRRPLFLGLVAVVVVLAVAGWYLLAGPGARTRVPDLSGKDRAAATALLAEHHLKARFSQAFDRSVGQGLVLGSTPGAGARLAWHTTVAVVLSKGPDWVQVPVGLVGSTADAATAALTGAGLVADAAKQNYSDTVAAGLVLAATLADGTDAVGAGRAVRGDTVTLTVSQGPAPVTLADLTGKTADQATAAIKGDELSLSVAEDWSDSVAVGAIISQKPAPGATVHRGDTIAVVVSKGPHLVPLASYFGQNVSTAQAALQSQGFTVVVDNPKGHAFNMVYSQSPSGGNNVTVPYGSTVTLYVF